MTRLIRIKIIHRLKHGTPLETLVEEFRLEEEEVREMSTYNFKPVITQDDVSSLEELGSEETVCL